MVSALATEAPASTTMKMDPLVMSHCCAWKTPIRWADTLQTNGLHLLTVSPSCRCRMKRHRKGDGNHLARVHAEQLRLVSQSSGVKWIGSMRMTSTKVCTLQTGPGRVYDQRTNPEVPSRQSNGTLCEHARNRPHKCARIPFSTDIT